MSMEISDFTFKFQRKIETNNSTMTRVNLLTMVVVGDHNVQLVYKFAHLAKIVKICL